MTYRRNESRLWCHEKDHGFNVISLILLCPSSPYKLYSKQEIPKRRLLTEEEYQEEAQRETLKALEELRGYCSSPECDSWRVVSRLKDPKRYLCCCMKRDRYYL